MLIQRAVLLDGRTMDIRVSRRIEAVADSLDPVRGEDVIDAAGGAVIPGLHDHHVHLRSAAAALSSVRVGPGEVRSRDALHVVLKQAAVGEDGWIRAVGYHEAVAGPLDRAVLDQVSPNIPVRVQHRSGVLWTLNSAGLSVVGLPDHPDGRLRSADPEPLSSAMQVSHSMLLNIIGRGGDAFSAARALIEDNHETRGRQLDLARQALAIYRTLRTAGIVEQLPAGRCPRSAPSIP